MSFSVVIVVVPPGVVIFVSCLADDFFVSVHPMMLIDVRPAISNVGIRRFISNNFHEVVTVLDTCFHKKQARNLRKILLIVNVHGQVIDAFST